MSCSTLSDEQLLILANKALITKRSQRWLSQHNLDGQGFLDLLTRTNYMSVNNRYGDNQKVPTIPFKFKNGVTPVETIVLCDTYRYQSCEASNWEESDAKKIIHAIREYAISCLPGIEEAVKKYW